MRDEHVGRLLLQLQPHEQVHERALHGDVQRGDGLVAEDQLRLGGEGARDGHALLLAAAQLVRQPFEVARRQAHRLQQLLRPRALACWRPRPPSSDSGRMMASPTERAGVERRVRVLEHHLDLSERRPRPPAGGGRQLACREGDLAASRRREADDGARHGGLAAAALAHHAQRLADADLDGPMPSTARMTPLGGLEVHLGAVGLTGDSSRTGRPRSAAHRPRWPPAGTRRVAARCASAGRPRDGTPATLDERPGALVHASSTNVQRGAKMQPAAARPVAGMAPGMVTSERFCGVTSKWGTQPRRSSVCRMQRRSNSSRNGACFHELTGVHDADRFADLRDDAEIVGDG